MRVGVGGVEGDRPFEQVAGLAMHIGTERHGIAARTQEAVVRVELSRALP